MTRAARVRVRAHDERGEPFELEAEGMLAVCIQHEMDHLVGKVFVDHLSPLKRARLAARLRKKQRLAGVDAAPCRRCASDSPARRRSPRTVLAALLDAGFTCRSC